MGFDTLNDYQPQPVKDGFEPFKGTFNCKVNHARIETYTGDKPEFLGVKFFRYELEVLEDFDHTGRRIWGSTNLSNDDRLKRLADVLFTLGLEFKNEEELEKCAEKFVDMRLKVRAWPWTPEGENEPRQMHIIKGLIETEVGGDPGVNSAAF